MNQAPFAIRGVDAQIAPAAGADDQFLASVSH
jgi:hypothetical protein